MNIPQNANSHNETNCRRDYIGILSDKENQRLYNPMLKRLLGTKKNSALFLRQAIYWWDRMGRRPFYKFLAPCSSDQYREGDSWQEELEFTRSELETALKHCATKITKGVSKNAAMNVTEPIFDKKRRLVNSKFLIVYWTDSSRLTWFWLNEELLENALNQLHLMKLQVQGGNLTLLGNAEISAIPTNAEISAIPTNAEISAIPTNAEISAYLYSETTGKDYDTETTAEITDKAAAMSPLRGLAKSAGAEIPESSSIGKDSLPKGEASPQAVESAAGAVLTVISDSERDDEVARAATATACPTNASLAAGAATSRPAQENAPQGTTGVAAQESIEDSRIRAYRHHIGCEPTPEQKERIVTEVKDERRWLLYLAMAGMKKLTNFEVIMRRWHERLNHQGDQATGAAA